MYSFFKHLFFLLPPEKAHYLAMDLLSFALKIPILNTFLKKSFKPKTTNQIQFCGITFPNDIGLAAGFDKDARWLHSLKYLGFGHIEIGTLTPKPQQGNNKPRLFRLKKDESLINRMGFNNLGVENAVSRLKNRPTNLIVGGNIGKNKTTPNENALQDYEFCFHKIYPYVDYIVINVSSPNTPNLRELQETAFLTSLFNSLHSSRNTKSTFKPILLKIAPDLSKSALEEIANLAINLNIDGLIISNTTIERKNLIESEDSLSKIGNGGLSGKSIFEKSNWALQTIQAMLPKNYPIIGVGGIYTKETATIKRQNGAKLLQLYTGFIYKGPSIVKQILD